MKDKKQILFAIIGVIVLITLIVCFVIAYKNHDSSSSATSSKASLNSTTITTGGSYTLSGNYDCITVDTTDSVELDLDGATITCESGPAINVISAQKVNIVLSGENTITSTTTEDLDGAIYSKDDIIFSGEGSLTIKSNYDGIVSKDDLVIKSGTYIINTDDDGIRGKDSVQITDGVFNINSGGDAIKSTNDEETNKGYVSISGGTFNIKTTIEGAKGIEAVTLIEINGGTFDIDTTDDAIHSNGNITINNGEFKINSSDDAIHADGLIEINDGTLNITAHEGIEATYVKVNGGTLNITASDDAINAGNKSTDYSATIEINGGNITVDIGQGDTDAIDSNGNIYVNGGTLDITAQSAFDYDGEAKYTGGTIIINGTTTNQITNQMMGGSTQMNDQNSRMR